MYPRLSIHIVAWNSMRFLPDLFKSLTEQTYQDFTVLVIDNGSTDHVETFIREQYPQITLLRNARNLGFSFAHNQGIRYALEHWNTQDYGDRFILVANPDLILTPTCLEMLMKSVDSSPTVGAFGPKLRRAFGEHVNDEVLQEIIKSDLIDTTGLRAQKNYIFNDRGAGEMDTGQYDQFTDVFGVSGACALYRSQALVDVRYADEFFDNDFFAYKEDVDLAWRLQQAGWNARFVPDALAHHYRGMYGPEQMGWFARLKHRRTKSRVRNYYSNRNHWLLLFKNTRFINALIASVYVIPLEMGRFFCTLIFETKNVRAFFVALGLFPRMAKKRLHAMAQRKRSAKDMRKWFG